MMMKAGPPKGDEFFEMNLPYCIIAQAVKREMEAIGSHIQVGRGCRILLREMEAVESKGGHATLKMLRRKSKTQFVNQELCDIKWDYHIVGMTA
jgi:hypothetical protein